MKEKKVLVSGCYDLIHGGHVAFFKTAAQFGKLYVAVGADSNLLLLKGKVPYFSHEERLYMVKAIRLKRLLDTSTNMMSLTICISHKFHHRKE